MGFMCSGKSTLGPALANEMNRTFIDLDQHIQDFCKSDISEIFEKKEEKYFRELESKLLKELNGAKSLISTGGGSPCYHDNLEHMNRHGITIYLDIPIHELIRRIKNERDQRPMVAGLDDEDLELKVLQLLLGRAPFYRKAQFHWNPEAEPIKDFCTRLKAAQ